MSPVSRKPVPVKKAEALPMPAAAAALGMAASYYLLPLITPNVLGRYLLPGIFFFFVFLIAYLRTLRLSPPGILPGAAVPALVAKMSILATAAIVGFTMGVAARQTVRSSVELGLPRETVISVSGVLAEDPRSLQGGSGLGILDLGECGGRGGLRATARGKLSVFFPAESIPRLKEFGRGCEVFLDGTLSSGSRGPVFSASSVHIVKPAPALEKFRTGLRLTLLEKFQSRQGRAPPVWGGLASALLLGIRDDLDADLSGEFRNSGCAHILALSGMHLAILSGVLAFLIRRPLGVRWASLIGAVFIVFYVFVAGSQPSLVRSAIMYLIGTFMIWGLLKGKPFSLLCMAFIIQIVFQSETGISLSFILSYLALTGILTMGESIRALFRGRLPEIINGSLSASLGAFIITAPVVVYYFGTLRPIGIIAGLLVAPISSLFIILSLIALALSFIPFPLWDIVSFVLTLVYRSLEFIVTIAGRVPGITVSNPFPVLIFTTLFWLAILLVRKWDSSHRNSVASFD